MNQFVDVKNLEIGGHTDVGRRNHNEDAFLIDRELGLIVVADGVGGHHSGEVASRLTCEVLQREVAAGADLGKAIERANAEVIDAVRTGKGKAGMGSTVVAVLMTETGYDVAWVGDSRAYLWDGKLSLLTRDHSFVESQLASGQISFEEARTHPRRHVILQAVGLQDDGNLNIGTNSGVLAPDSCLLLCSDGITDPLDSARLSQLLSQRTTPDETCQNIVNTAVQSGGKDNSTAVMIVHGGTLTDPPRDAGPARVVWVFDPATAVYTGLPDVTVQSPEPPTMILQAPVQRAKPGNALALAPQEDAAFEENSTSRYATAWRYVWMAAVLGMIALGLAYFVR